MSANAQILSLGCLRRISDTENSPGRCKVQIDHRQHCEENEPFFGLLAHFLHSRKINIVRHQIKQRTQKAKTAQFGPKEKAAIITLRPANNTDFIWERWFIAPPEKHGTGHSQLPWRLVQSLDRYRDIFWYVSCHFRFEPSIFQIAYGK